MRGQRERRERDEISINKIGEFVHTSLERLFNDVHDQVKPQALPQSEVEPGNKASQRVAYYALLETLVSAQGDLD